MAFPISSIGFGASLPVQTGSAPKESDGNVFTSMFKDAVARVEDQHKIASAQIESFLSGENEDLHTTVLAVQRAELTFELFQQVRNKVVQAYQEIMRQPL